MSEFFNLFKSLHVLDLGLGELIVHIVKFTLQLEVQNTIVDFLIDDWCILYLHGSLCKLKGHYRFLNIIFRRPYSDDECGLRVAT